MKLELPDMSLPKLEMPRLGLRAFQRRLFLRAVFVLLIVATLGLALAVLQDEKERSYQNYQASFKKTQSEILARLRHPAGQLALLNPERSSASGTLGQALSPLVLPFGSLDFDDPYKAQQAIDSAGCAVQFADGSTACAAIGSNPYAGGFIYLAGSFASPPLVGRERGQLELQGVHRVHVTLSMRGQTSAWVAPLELQERDANSPSNTLVGRWTAFVESDTHSERNALQRETRPVRDFRGWVWQGNACFDAASAEINCPRRAFYSIRLPAESLRDAIWRKTDVAWPPADLADFKVSMQVHAATGKLFDTHAPRLNANSPVAELSQSLLPGETLHIKRLSGRNTHAPAQQIRAQSSEEPISPWVLRIVSLLPVDTRVPPLKTSDIISTPVGNFEASLSGDVRAVERRISAVATRMLWLVGAMLGAIITAWLLIEIGFIRRVTELTRRAAAVSYNVNAPELDKRLVQLDVSDLRGKDELGILAGGLSDLLGRVKDDISREHIRAAQERDMWHAVGHEIMSPLQSLMVLHGQDTDPSRRYVQRMQQAIKVLYGQASPSEAIAQAAVASEALDVNAFLQEVASNAHFSGIESVKFEPLASPVLIQADSFALEDVVTHILSNAQRHRIPGTPIQIRLQASDGFAWIRIHNQGAPIPSELMSAMFDYGVSSAKRADEPKGHRGQGLFVVKTYLQKMGGTVEAVNVNDGVEFVLKLPTL